MYELIVKDKFSAAHRLLGYEGSCSRLHGHTWIIVVGVKYKTLNEIGIAEDFKKIKDTVKTEIIDILDHQNLNEVLLFNPTAEKLAKYSYDRLEKKLPVSFVEIWESDTAGVRYESE